MSNEKTKRIEIAISETIRFIDKEEKYLPHLQNKELLGKYKAHLTKLNAMLKTEASNENK